MVYACIGCSIWGIYNHLYADIIVYKHLDRASIEPNFHDLYLKFLDKINSKPLIREIVQATYENCKVWAIFFLNAVNYLN